MSGVMWAGASWLSLIAVWSWIDRRAGRDRVWLNRENIALLVAMLGTVSIAQTTTTDELLREPVVLERALRGSLAGLSALIAGPVLLNRLRDERPTRRYVALTALTAYLAVATITVLYSVSPLVTAAKAFELGAGLIVVGAAALAPDGRRRLGLMVTFVIALLGSLLLTATIGFFVLPETFSSFTSFRPGFIMGPISVAPFASSNELSAAGAIITTFAIAQLIVASTPRARVWWTLGLVVALFGTILAAGRQGIIMLLASTLVLLGFRRRKLFFGILAPALIVGLWLGWDSVFRVFSRGQPGLLTNFTGRLPWWQAALEAWGEHPWTGYGYGVGGRFVSLSNIGRSDVSNVHNGYLEALIGVGLIGAIPLLLAVGLVVSWSIGSLRRGEYVAVAVLAFPVVIHTFIDLGFGGWLKPDFVLLTCLAALSDWRRSTGEPLPTKVDWQTSDDKPELEVSTLN